MIPLLLLSSTAWAQGLQAPVGPLLDDLENVPALVLAGPDRARLYAEDARRVADGLPDRFADPRAVTLDAETDGAWHQLADGSWLWRARVTAAGADHLNFGFGRFHLPADARLLIVDAAGHDALSRPLTAADNKPHGEFWTPVLRTDEALLEAWVPPSAREELALVLAQVGVGYKGFGAAEDKSGSCNVDVACPEGDPWRGEIASVAVYGSQGSTWCTGFMVNNTAQDQRPLFQTASHCGLSTRSLVVYWNYESPSCGQQNGGRYDDWQSGGSRLADDRRSDFDLIELDALPDPDWEVAYAGWDHSGDDASSSVGIHHPSTDEKAISFSDRPTAVTSYSGSSSPGDSSHVRVKSWDDGTTEGGSSGSPLFNQDHQVIGQLHGGSASCNNSSSDWYGALAASWDGGGSSGSRLRDHLDPLGTGQETLDTLAPWLGGLTVTPDGDVASQGPRGGEFLPERWTWTLENSGGQSVDWTAQVDVSWLQVDVDGGTLRPNSTQEVTVDVARAARDLALGVYTGTVLFSDLDGGTEVLRTITLQVGVPTVVWSWPMDSDPGWNLEGGWEWGEPLGRSAPDGSPDPSSGHTGSAVLGYDLAGAYPDEMAPEHATLGPLDMRGLRSVALRYWRWLGVEGAPYDFAQVALSTDGEQWETLWTADGEVDDGAWTEVALDLSAWADDAPQVWLRWTMGRSDGRVEHCGWNLDDVTIEAVVDQAGEGDTGGGRIADPIGGGEWTQGGWGCGSGGAAGGLVALLAGVLALGRRRVWTDDGRHRDEPWR